MKVVLEISGKEITKILSDLQINSAFSRDTGSLVASVMINKFNLDSEVPHNSCITYPNLDVGESLATEYDVKDLVEVQNLFNEFKDKLGTDSDLFVYQSDIRNFNRRRNSSMILTTSRDLAGTMYDFN